MGKIAEIYVSLKADIKGLQTNLTKAQNSLQGVQKHTAKIGKTINKDLTPSMSKFGKLMKSTAGQIAMGFGLGMGVTGILLGTKKAITSMVTKGREFEKSWANVTTMLSLSNDETKKLKDELLRLSPTLGDTTQLAEGMYQVLSASIEPAKAIKFLGEAAKAAKAGVTETKVAVDALTTVINAYGMAAEDVTDVSDIMFQAVKSGKLTYEELAASLGTVVPVASQVEVSFEDIAAATATLTRQGIDAQTATMQLRQVFMSVLKPGNEAKKMAEKLGIEFNLAGLKSKGLVGFLKDIKEKTGGNTKSMAALVPNVRALTGVLALAGEQSEAFAKDQIKMLNAAGLTEEAFRKQMKTVDFWIETAKTSIDKFKIAFWDGFTTPLKEGIKSSEDLEKATQELITTFQELGKAIGSIVVPAYQGLMAHVNKALDLNKKMKLLIEGLALAIKNKQIPTLKNMAKAWTENYIEQKEAIKWAEKNKEGVASFIEKLTGLKVNLGTATEASKKFGKSIEKDVIPPLEEVKEKTEEFSETIINTVIPAMRQLPGVAWNTQEEVKSAFFNANEEIKEDFEETTEAITISFKSMTERFVDLAMDMGDAFGNFAYGVMDKGSTLGENLKGLWTDIGNAFKSMVAEYIADEMKKLFLSIIGKTTEMATSVTSGISAIGPAITGIATGIAGLITGLATAIATAATTLAAAAPALLIVLGIALAAYAGFKIISSLFKKAAKTGTMEAILKDISHIQLAAMLDKMDTSNFFLSEMFPKFDYGNHQLELIVGIAKKVRDGVNGVIKAIKAIPKAQHGAIVTRPQLIMAGESGPEAIIPLNKPGAIQGVAGGQTTIIAPVFNISAMDAIGVRDFMRTKGLPEIIEAVNVNYRGSKTRLKEAQGI